MIIPCIGDAQLVAFNRGVSASLTFRVQFYSGFGLAFIAVIFNRGVSASLTFRVVFVPRCLLPRAKLHFGKGPVWQIGSDEASEWVIP